MPEWIGKVSKDLHPIKKDLGMNIFTENVEKVTHRLNQIKIVPVLAIDDVNDGLRMCEILNRQGLYAAEITFRTTAAENIIKQASKEYPDLLLGAGTILNANDLQRAFRAGAEFAVAPGFNPIVVKEAVKHGYPFFPGVVTPSEVEQAMELGCRMLKFFPAEAAGGLPMLKSLLAPYKHLGIKFMPTGGLKPNNITEYLKLPEIPAAGGTWLGSKMDIELKNWTQIENYVIEAVQIVNQLLK